ncbi:class I SAM-dependent methyltransferase [Streptomyces sp. NPDC005963]|uniref:class I SAM-dependent methyltransferase n=1 Tax=Streptomyces sp. NPDC005963 TaxID=3156721 RepID=UPI0033F2B24C
MTQRPTPAAELFDALGLEYEHAFGKAPAHQAALAWLIERLAPASEVLDIGSGTGRPTAETLADAGHRVLGVDISLGMVEIARHQVPNASFRHQDARTLDLPEASMDAVCAFYPFLQMPRSDQQDLVRKITRWLRPGGHLLAATVALDVEGAAGRWMGHDVEVTSFAAEAFTALLEASGLEVLRTEELDFTPASEGAITEPQVFVYARRP